MKKKSLYPKTAKEALDKWDAGESVFTMERGGLGPGYEQCIHIVVFELIRAFHDKKMPRSNAAEDVFTKLSKTMDKYLFSLPKIKELGLSGAQVGAAKGLALKTIKYGWRKMMEKAPSDLIQVSKNFPG